MASIFQQIFLGKRIELKSLLNKKEVMTRLQDNHCNPKWYERPDFNHAFVGEVKEDRFRLTRLKHIKSSLAPLLSGQVFEAAEGSRIELKIRLHPLILVILMLILGGMLAAAGVLIGYSQLDQAIDFVFFVPVLIILLILSLVIMMLLDESKAAETELLDLLECY